MLIRLLRPLGRFTLWIFFRRIDLRSSTNQPPAGPVIFVANHPNVALDVLLLACFLPSKNLRFLGKSTLFSNPVFSWLLRGLGVIPVVRSREGGNGGRNRDMLRSSCGVLKEGGSLVLFPEGMSHPEPRVLKLKPGASKIALRASAEGTAGVTVIPVGLTYTDPELFRGDVFIHIGQEIEVHPYMASYREDRTESERRLTYRIGTALKELTQHIDNRDLDQVILDLTTIYGKELATQMPESEKFSQMLGARKEISRAAHHFSMTDPGLVRSVSEQLGAHRSTLRHFGIDATAFPEKKPSTSLLLLTLLSVPLVLYGFVHNALPYYLPRLLLRRYAREKEMVATVKLVSGAISFPLVYLIMFSSVYSLTDPEIALVYGLSMPVSGLLTLGFYERVLHRRSLWRLLIFPRRRKNQLELLEIERARIISLLDSLKNRYIEDTSGTDQNEDCTSSSEQEGNP